MSPTSRLVFTSLQSRFLPLVSLYFIFQHIPSPILFYTSVVKNENLVSEWLPYCNLCTDLDFKPKEEMCHLQ